MDRFGIPDFGELGKVGKFVIYMKMMSIYMYVLYILVFYKSIRPYFLEKKLVNFKEARLHEAILNLHIHV